MPQRESNGKILHDLSFSQKRRMENFRAIEVNKRGDILLTLSRKVQAKILEQLHDEELLVILRYLSPDETTDLLRNIAPGRRKALVEKLEEEKKVKVNKLLSFNPRSAAGIMSTDYISVPRAFSFEDLSKEIKKHEQRTGRFPAMLVVEEGMLKGELQGHVLALHMGKEKIEKYVKKLPVIEYDASERDVISMFRKHEHDKVVVLDKNKSILGVIYSDDILGLLQSQGKSLSTFAGVREEESVSDTVLAKVKNRYKWLIVNLWMMLIAATVVSLFERTISAFVFLAFYMPVIAGLGGNVGTQALAVVVRGMALHEIDIETGKRLIFKEIAAGAINGLIIGLIVAVTAFALHRNPVFGMIIGISVIVNLINASFFGAAVPLLLTKLGKDPASSATIFITTASDVCGFFVFLGLASLLL
ncbi:MAG: magnesium transporter [Candidatus Diapherotrites archaeon]|uniref:Magnesium transporter n=1 Tax=Candidatus Iainarchaeum sp. TaxID=3101447 RepID=A0A938YY07_9ARCH|nr:magnesium transporter [Candidatus Diapherotrites archaeon]